MLRKTGTIYKLFCRLMSAFQPNVLQLGVIYDSYLLCSIQFFLIEIFANKSGQ